MSLAIFGTWTSVMVMKTSCRGASHQCVQSLDVISTLLIWCYLPDVIKAVWFPSRDCKLIWYWFYDINSWRNPDPDWWVGDKTVCNAYQGQCHVGAPHSVIHLYKAQGMSWCNFWYWKSSTSIFWKWFPGGCAAVPCLICFPKSTDFSAAWHIRHVGEHGNIS